MTARVDHFSMQMVGHFYVQSNSNTHTHEHQPILQPEISHGSL
ncbi:MULTISPECIES: hypothetical protein [unclassified Colwellia]|nr:MULTISPECIES: hypothetical protein [unclassified Colwellia]